MFFSRKISDKDAAARFDKICQYYDIYNDYVNYFYEGLVNRVFTQENY